MKTWNGLGVLICLVTLITVRVHKASPNRNPGLTEPTPYIKTLPKHALFWWTHEDLANCKRSTQNLTRCKIFVSNFDACLKNCFEIWHVRKYSNQNLTHKKLFNSKYDRLYFFQFEICSVVFLSILNLTPNKNINSKSCFLKKHEKCKICRFYGVKWMKTCCFESKNFFVVWYVEKPLIQNLTPFIFFNPKSDAL